MVPSGLAFGSHKATDRTHLRARPGGSAVKAPPQGGISKICKFLKKKSLSRVSQHPYHHRTIGWARTKNIPRAQPPAGYRWGARAPQICHFCRLQFAYSANRLDEFSSYLPHRFSVCAGIFLRYSEWGVTRRNTPKIDPQKSVIFPFNF